ncbi:MAG: hypothetical protein E7106_07895 [Prevotella sp.]|nr:hypothetical protein [Prevotella sp.]
MTAAQAQTDSISKVLEPMDSIAVVDMQTLETEKTTSVVVDSNRVKKPKRDWNTWRPNPKRALWLALVLPGAGQIYNRKYWKLPIIYGGFMGCIYALTWNNMMYKDYSQAYLDIMDNDPGTASYNKFLHLGVEINDQNMERYKSLFKSRKDKYRRWRDLSFFVMLGVYAISVIDAYVDAELSEFDISKDLSLKVSPAVIPNYSGGNPLQAQSLGVNCSLNF